MVFTYIENELLYLQGDWIQSNARKLLEELNAVKDFSYSKLDLNNILHIDTIGVVLILRFCFDQDKAFILSQDKPWYPFFTAIAQTSDEANIFAKKACVETELNDVFYRIGRLAANGLRDLLFALNFIGNLAYALGYQRKRVNEFISFKQRLAPYIENFNKLGTTALPIILLLSFIIGGVMAQQGALQLRSFGAEIYVVNLTGILICRELGVLLTAILIAGRCGSAITGELGVMQMQGEIAALKIMGLDIFRKLYLPRTIAILIAVPLLTLFANIAALFGASCISYFYSHISFKLFFYHLRNDLYYSTYFVGLAKAPFLALAIAIISIVESVKISGSSSALARYIISCVVKSIFSVIVIDALLAIIITHLGY